jgi:hypothetical protein
MKKIAPAIRHYKALAPSDMEQNKENVPLLYSAM